MEEDRFSRLSSYSAKLHGHKYVLPVAVWLLESDEKGAISQPEIRVGLVHAESVRIFEALGRLVDIGALAELPKVSGRRYFEQTTSPYWAFVAAAGAALDTEVRP